MSNEEVKEIRRFADMIENAFCISIASGDREPDSRVSTKGREWIVAALRKLAEENKADGGTVI